jgi:hypothetical protein
LLAADSRPGLANIFRLIELEHLILFRGQHLRLAGFSRAIRALQCLSAAIICFISCRERPLQGTQSRQDRPACIGGQLTVPNEQKTQQSPFSGFNSAWQVSHS